MTEIIAWIMDSIRAYGPWSVFTGVIVESVIVPIPSPLIIMGAGIYLNQCGFEFRRSLGADNAADRPPGAIASTLGAYVGYAIGYLRRQAFSRPMGTVPGL